MSSLGKNLSANLASNAWSTILSIVLTPVYVKVLGLESYALIGLYLSWVGILAILDAGISATATREIAWLSARSDRRSEVAALMRSLELVYVGIVVLTGALILAAAWANGEHWLKVRALSPLVVRDALMLMALSLVAQVPSGLYLGGVMGLQRQAAASIVVAVFGTLRGLGAVAALWLTVPDIRVFFAWQIVVCLAQTAVLRWLVWRAVAEFGGQAHPSLARLDGVKRFAGGMFLLSIVGMAISQADKFVLARFVPLDVIGRYVIAWTVAGAITRVATPLMQVFGPRFTELESRGAHEQLVREVHLASQLINAMVLPPVLTMLFFARPLLDVWLRTPDVAGNAAPILATLVVGVALSVCAYPALSALYSRQVLRPVIRLNVGALVLGIPLLAVLVSRYGVMAAAWLWVAYGSALFIGYQHAWRRVIGGEPLIATIARDFLRPCAATLAIVALARYMVGVPGSTPLFIAQIALMLVLGWLAAGAACPELRTAALRRLATWQQRIA